MPPPYAEPGGAPVIQFIGDLHVEHRTHSGLQIVTAHRGWGAHRCLEVVAACGDTAHRCLKVVSAHWHAAHGRLEVVARWWCAHCRRQIVAAHRNAAYSNQT